MPNEQDQDHQERAFNFLVEKYNSQQLFTKDEFQAATGWGDVSFKTYMSKQFKELLIPIDGKYRVHGVFGRFTDFMKFCDNVVTQNRKLQKPYKISRYENVMLFDFFMPLRNEEYLRNALDSLFFKDSILFRLNSLNEEEMHKHFPKQTVVENKDVYFGRICDWISEKFVGYSIHHVSGRFRVGALKTRAEVYDKTIKSVQRYLVDETTAVVRFIIPCTVKPEERNKSQCQLLPEKDEEKRIRWFFENLFVQRITEVVGGEDEIWVLESGMRNQLHIWRQQQ